jgi:hypothetical protein
MIKMIHDDIAFPTPKQRKKTFKQSKGFGEKMKAGFEATMKSVTTTLESINVPDEAELMKGVPN